MAARVVSARGIPPYNRPETVPFVLEIIIIITGELFGMYTYFSVGGFHDLFQMIRCKRLLQPVEDRAAVVLEECSSQFSNRQNVILSIGTQFPS